MPEGLSRLEHIIQSKYAGDVRGVYVAAFTIYIDDSGATENDKIAAVGGFLAPMNKWKRFEREWGKAKSDPAHKFSVMHMAEFVAGNQKSEFRDWSLDQKQSLLKRLRHIIKQEVTHGLVHAISYKDYDEIVTGEEREKAGKHQFTWVLRNLLGHVDVWRKSNHVGGQVEYVFDWMESKDPRRIEIETSLEKALEEPDSLARYGLTAGGWTFRHKEELAPLQAADMLAWTIFHAVKNHKSPKMNKLGSETLRDFGEHNSRGFIIGGFTTKEQMHEYFSIKDDA